jgi:hypothetical protein
VYNIHGQEQETLVNRFQTPGVYEIIWQPKRGFPNGVYFYRLIIGEFSQTKKISFQK